ncbi:MAG: InlB B-repeat-containing protein [Collinsella sp.]
MKVETGKEPAPEPEPEPQPMRHTVDFMVDGNKVASLIAVDGKLEGEAPVPTKDGWMFEGWFTKDGALFDFSKPIDRDMVLTAKWSKPLTRHQQRQSRSNPPSPHPSRRRSPRPLPTVVCRRRAIPHRLSL